jgi:hypothetical protein
VQSHAGAKDFSSGLCVQTGSVAHLASYPGLFPGCKAQVGHDADNLFPSSAEVKIEQELKLLLPQAPPWHVVGHLYFYHSQYGVSIVHLKIELQLLPR